MNLYPGIELHPIGRDQVIHNLEIHNLCKNMDVSYARIPKSCYFNPIGGYSIRPIGDTCHMFYKLPVFDETCEYYFWSGIVTKSMVQMESINGVSPRTFRLILLKGLAMGDVPYRMVLTEKIRA